MANAESRRNERSRLGQQLKARGLQYTSHYTEGFMGRWQRTLLDADDGVYRYDTLFVLKKTRMPAVLLEAGSIANPDEELARLKQNHLQTTILNWPIPAGAGRPFVVELDEKLRPRSAIRPWLFATAYLGEPCGPHNRPNRSK